MWKIIVFFLMLMVTPAFAETITIIVPHSPGGATDLIARVAAKELNRIDGNTYVIENSFGASGDIALKKAIDYHKHGRKVLLFIFGGPFIFNQVTNNDDFDRLSDITFIPPLLSNPFAVVVPRDSSYTNVNDMLKKSDINVGVAGILTEVINYHLTKASGIKTTLIKYRSNDDVYLALKRHELVYAVVNITSSVLNNPDIKVLAVTGDQRLSEFPDVPTLKELGYEDANLESYELWAVIGSNDHGLTKKIPTINATDSMKRIFKLLSIRQKTSYTNESVRTLFKNEQKHFANDYQLMRTK